MILLVLFFTGLFAGTVDAIAGGGGLISLPVLLSMGVPPHIAFGTNKLQGMVGTLVATLKYYRHGYISMQKIYLGILFGLLGGVLGSIAAQIMSSEILRKIIPIMLFIILVYTICSPRMGQIDKKPKMNEFLFYLTFGFALAFYDGFLGPGTGSFWVFALTFFMGFNLIKATAYTKVFNLNSSFIAMLCFAIGGNIDYRLGLTMAAGQIIGGRLGAHLAITKGARLIRPFFLGMVSLTISTLVYKSYSSSDLFVRVSSQYGLVPQVAVVAILILSLVFLYLKVSKRQKTELS
jgi:uncharacterized membrane protein YfcA